MPNSNRKASELQNPVEYPGLPQWDINLPYLAMFCLSCRSVYLRRQRQKLFSVGQMVEHKNIRDVAIPLPIVHSISEYKCVGNCKSHIVDFDIDFPAVGSVEEAYDFFRAIPSLERKLWTLKAVGMGYIKIEGQLVLVGEIGPVIDEWTKTGSMPADVANLVHNTVVPNCIPTAMLVARDIRLPPPVPFPRINIQQQKKAGSASSGMEVA